MDNSLYQQWVDKMQPIYDSLEDDNFQEMIAVGQDSVFFEDLSKWIQGDLASLIETRYGAKDLEQFAKEINVFPNTLGNRRTLSKFWELNTRWELMNQNPYLKYTHFKLGMEYGKRKVRNDGLESDMAIHHATALVLEASANIWTPKQMQFEVQQRVQSDKVRWEKVADVTALAQFQMEKVAWGFTVLDGADNFTKKQYRLVVYEAVTPDNEEKIS